MSPAVSALRGLTLALQALAIGLCSAAAINVAALTLADVNHARHERAQLEARE